MKTIKTAVASFALLAVFSLPAQAGVMDIPYEEPICDPTVQVCPAAASQPTSPDTETQDASTDTTTLPVQILSAVVSTLLGL